MASLESPVESRNICKPCHEQGPPKLEAGVSAANARCSGQSDVREGAEEARPGTAAAHHICEGSGSAAPPAASPDPSPGHVYCKSHPSARSASVPSSTSCFHLCKKVENRGERQACACTVSSNVCRILNICERSVPVTRRQHWAKVTVTY